MTEPWQVVARSWAAKAQRLEPENRRLKDLLRRGIELMGPNPEGWTVAVEDWIWEAHEVLDDAT